ncbi:MAG TPA: thioredoxin domain-containing protein [Deinococcales bacterium]|nr:thioredoxin domain-containing protein [Deinococcales bacterium]
MNTQRLTQITVGIIAVAILAVIVVSRLGSASAASFDLEGTPVLGSPDAAVKVVIFEDFLCPHCATFTEQILPQVRSEFSGNDDVAFHHVNFLVMPGSDAAATVAECVYRQDNDAFWEVQPVFMRSQDQLSGRSNALELAGEYAPGIDRSELAECAEDPAVLEHVRDQGTMASSAGATGTPAIFVNGTLVNTSVSAINGAIRDALP